MPFQTSPKDPDPIFFSNSISVPIIWVTEDVEDDVFVSEAVTIVQFESFLFGKLFGRAE